MDPERRKKEEGPGVGYNECKGLADGIWLGDKRLFVSEVGWDLGEWYLGDGWGRALGPRGLDCGTVVIKSSFSASRSILFRRKFCTKQRQDCELAFLSQPLKCKDRLPSG